PTAAGEAAAAMALTAVAPDWVPADVFSPCRLLSQEPAFMSQKDGLWRIAESLCQQLRAVNRQIADEYLDGPQHSTPASGVSAKGGVRKGVSIAPAGTVDVGLLSG